jgi:cytochrome c-type biogenesis protein CcmH
MFKILNVTLSLSKGDSSPNFESPFDKLRVTLSILIILFFIFPALALSPEPRLADETQEKRAMQLFLEVRCLVCNGQVIENSDTEFSFAMRQLIRKKISENKSDKEIREELVKEFGDDILTKPSSKTLWILPIVFALILLLLLKTF